MRDNQTAKLSGSKVNYRTMKPESIIRDAAVFYGQAGGPSKFTQAHLSQTRNTEERMINQRESNLERVRESRPSSRSRSNRKNRIFGDNFGNRSSQNDSSLVESVLSG